jgi:hypothetical protein
MRCELCFVGRLNCSGTGLNAAAEQQGLEIS